MKQTPGALTGGKATQASGLQTGNRPAPTPTFSKQAPKRLTMLLDGQVGLLAAGALPAALLVAIFFIILARRFLARK